MHVLSFAAVVKKQKDGKRAQIQHVVRDALRDFLAHDLKVSRFGLNDRQIS